MSKWIRRLEIADEWEKASDGEISVSALARVIAEKLKALRPLKGFDDADEERRDLAEQFADAATDTDLSKSEFDDLMSDLYDWADTPLDDNFAGKKACWINTLDKVSA